MVECDSVSVRYLLTTYLLGDLDERAMVVLTLRVDGGLCEHRLGAEVLDQPVGSLEGG